MDFTAAGGRPERVLDMLDHAAWAADPRYADRLARLNPALVDEWNAQFLVWCLERSKREIWAAARRARVMCAPLFTTRDLYEDEHFRGRGFWSTVDHPAMGTVEFPGRPFILQKGGWQARRPAPLLGQHTEEVLRALDQPPPATETSPPQPAPPPAFAPTATSSRAPKPLAGYRVIDLCVVWAGPFATVQLGDLGAEVIKVENPFVWQPGTRGGMAHPPAQMLAQANAWGGGYPHNEPGPRPWNYSPTFVSNFRNKKSVTMDLRRPEGMAIFRRLVERSDVVYENNATDTLESLGITYDWLKSVKPEIIFVRAPAYGSSGAYATARALGVHLEGVMGHTLLRGYDDLDPSTTMAVYSGDYLAGCQGALAVMAALRVRERTGKGQLVELAQAENAAAMFTQAIMDYTLNRRVQTTVGNRDIFGRFPCGVYPAKSPGDATTAEDHWVAIHVESDAGWQAFKRVMGDPAWAEDARFADNAGRAEHCREIDAGIAAWTVQHGDYAIAERCQAAGIAAMPVLEASRLFADPQLRARSFFRSQTLPDVGTYEFMGPMWQFGETPVEYLQPPVTFGEHNEEVYRTILGYSDAEIARFRAEGHIATEYDPSVP